ncbi:MAG: uroporphyrinogen-III C-methyltransferase, partial [Synergistaceae bacterium]|nr:uroporphyrinogen-III C-methyltransferase [Synergistaceae bacterium]
MRGKVWLVGGGPGDPELLTVKGRRILEEADVVVYDRLIGSGILRCAPLGAELIDVGKNGGCHPVPQEEIEKILIEKALENKRVVRLKGGDPFLFGRGGEEMSTLMSRGIPCEPVPGVTSAIAVPAWAGIPVTHRDYASSIHIVTAHRRDGAPIDYDALAPLKGTLVFLMGASALRDICEGLIAAGMDKNTPAAAIQRGTTARQKQVIGVLADLPERAAQSKGIHAPAVMVVGQVVALSETLNWRAALPLAGRRVLVPRPESHLPQKGGSGGRSGRLAALLRARGAEVVEVSPSRMENIDLPLPPLGGYLWLVFTSGTGVECFFQRLRADQRDIREIGTAKIAAIGSMTRNAIEERGLRVDLV